MFERILVAIDQSSGPALLPQAITLAQAHNASLLLLHVLNESVNVPLYPGMDTFYPASPVLQVYAEEWAKVETHHREWLKDLAKHAQAAGIKVESEQILGDPGQLICRVASRWGADVILVGRRARSGLSELFLGSVSNHVLHHADCAVLTLKDQVLVKTKGDPVASRSF
jgi:nucleotide-binding universal stress UspA family protein